MQNINYCLYNFNNVWLFLFFFQSLSHLTKCSNPYLEDNIIFCINLISIIENRSINILRKVSIILKNRSIRKHLYSIILIEMNFLGHEGNFQRQAGVTDLIQLNSNISEFKPTVCWQIIYPQFRFIIRFKSFNHTKFLTLLFIPFNFLQKNVFYQYKYSRLGQFAIPFLNELLSCTSIWLYEKIRDAKSFLLCSILYVSLKTYMF